MTGWDNVLAGGAIGISITGMAIVFCGLVLISFSISALPPLLDFLTRYLQKPEGMTATEFQQGDSETEAKDLASVIGLVLQMEASLCQTPQEREETDLAQVIGLVLQLERDRVFGLPN